MLRLSILALCVAPLLMPSAAVAQSPYVNCSVVITGQDRRGSGPLERINFYYRNTCGLSATVRWRWDDGIDRADHLGPHGTGRAACYISSSGCSTFNPTYYHDAPSAGAQGYAGQPSGGGVGFDPGGRGSGVGGDPTQDLIDAADKAARDVFGDPDPFDQNVPPPDPVHDPQTALGTGNGLGGVSIAVDPTPSDGSISGGLGTTILDLSK